MNYIKQLDIRLSRDYFYPGDQIEGQLVVDVLESFHLNQVHLLVRGKAHCEWKVYISGDRRIIKDDQYFIDERTLIWDSAQEEAVDDEEEADAPEDDQEQQRKLSMQKTLVKEGRHEFHFSFQLPLKDMPCSLESRACSIRYHLRAILDVLDTVSGGDGGPLEIPQGVKYFTMIGPIVDCNEDKYLVSG